MLIVGSVQGLPFDVVDAELKAIRNQVDGHLTKSTQNECHYETNSLNSCGDTADCHQTLGCLSAWTYPFRVSAYEQLVVSDLPVAFQHTIMERHPYNGQRHSQSLGCLIEIAYAFSEDSVQFV